VAIIKLAPNVPEAIELKYVDVKVGTYGPQLQLKGRGKDGGDRVLYVSVDCSPALVKAGAALVETEKGQTYKPVSGWWVAEKRQAAGEKYATTYLYPEGESPAPKIAPPPQPLTERPAALRETGDVLPWEANPKDEKAVLLFWDCFDKVLEGVARRKLTDLFKPENLASLTATLYIQRSKLT